MYDNIIIEFCRAGTEKIKFMEFKLSNCLIGNIESSGGGGEFPAETIKINYGKIELVYTQQKRAGGQASGKIAGGWNVEKNCKV